MHDLFLHAGAEAVADLRGESSDFTNRFDTPFSSTSAVTSERADFWHRFMPHRDQRMKAPHRLPGPPTGRISGETSHSRVRA
jgi:hypothetical protein